MNQDNIHLENAFRYLCQATKDSLELLPIREEVRALQNGKRQFELRNKDSTNALKSLNARLNKLTSNARALEKSINACHEKLVQALAIYVEHTGRQSIQELGNLSQKIQQAFDGFNASVAAQRKITINNIGKSIKDLDNTTVTQAQLADYQKMLDSTNTAWMESLDTLLQKGGPVSQAENAAYVQELLTIHTSTLQKTTDYWDAFAKEIFIVTLKSILLSNQQCQLDIDQLSNACAKSVLDQALHKELSSISRRLNRTNRLKRLLEEMTHNLLRFQRFNDMLYDTMTSHNKARYWDEIGESFEQLVAANNEAIRELGSLRLESIIDSPVNLYQYLSEIEDCHNKLEEVTKECNNPVLSTGYLEYIQTFFDEIKATSSDHAKAIDFFLDPSTAQTGQILTDTEREERLRQEVPLSHGLANAIWKVALHTTKETTDPLLERIRKLEELLGDS